MSMLAMSGGGRADLGNAGRHRGLVAAFLFAANTVRCHTVL